MCRWLAVLVFVPGLAWGEQMTPQQCVSESYKMEFTRIALEVMEDKKRGLSEEGAVRASLGEGQASAVMLTAVEHVYQSDTPSPGMVATAMAITCYQYAQGR